MANKTPPRSRPLRFFSPPLAVAVLLASACGLPDRTLPSDFDRSQYQSEREQALADLQHEQGQLEVRSQPQLGTVASLRFLRPVQLLGKRGDSPSATVRSFVLRYRAILGLSIQLTGDSFDSRSLDSDALGMRHLSLVQSRSGVPIWGSRLLAHLAPAASSDGMLLRLVSLQGHLYPLPLLSSADPKPTLSPEDARQRGLALARQRAANAIVTAKAPTLYYLPAGDQLNLVYRLELVGQDDNLPLHWALFVDAQSGELRAQEDLVARVDVAVPALGSGSGALGATYQLSISERSGGFQLFDPLRGAQRTTAVSGQQKLPGKTVSSDDPDRWDQAGPGAGLAVDLHAHVAALWDYFATVHGRFGWDGAGHGAVAVAHFGSRANLALFDGERLLFGDGDGQSFAPLGAAFDIVAHEYSHATIRATADLAAEGEAGALDEGFADLMAAAIAQIHDPQDGSWRIGQSVYHPGGRPTAIADLADPHRSGQAAALAEFVTTGDAASTVSSLARHNGGIVGHLGYLLAQRVGLERSVAIVYRSLTYYLFRYAGFADAADAMAAAARDLYDDPTAAAVVSSWGAVGL